MKARGKESAEEGDPEDRTAHVAMPYNPAVLKAALEAPAEWLNGPLSGCRPAAPGRPGPDRRSSAHARSRAGAPAGPGG
ncbi:hypothetical protein GCM10022295_35940 [Streptomyces osmaniensis]|uniref:Uncharacterized protein n=1 Tax=Streptomyces osmaniensis TaxID=593134 RepID=A0ABP6WHP9_9ACTN